MEELEKLYNENEELLDELIKFMNDNDLVGIEYIEEDERLVFYGEEAEW